MPSVTCGAGRGIDHLDKGLKAASKVSCRCDFLAHLWIDLFEPAVQAAAVLWRKRHGRIPEEPARASASARRRGAGTPPGIPPPAAAVDRLRPWNWQRGGPS